MPTHTHTYCRYDERRREQDDDEPILSDEAYEEGAPSNAALSLEQQKAELKRRIMQPAPKR